MRAIEEYSVSGTIDDEPVKGKVTAYIKNILKAIPLGLKNAVLKEWKKVDKKVTEAVTNLEDYVQKHQELSKKIVAGTLALVIAGSMVGCKMSPKAEVNDEIAIEQSQKTEEQRVPISYTIVSGDTLEGLVRRYDNIDFVNEIKKICKENNIENPNRIYAGQKLKLNVPVSKLEKFGFTYTNGEVDQFDAMDYFVFSAFNVSSDKVHPQNMVFWRDKQYVVGDLGKERPQGLEPMTESSLLTKAANARYDLEIMTGDQYGFYSEKDIKSKKTEIFSYYQEAIEIAERNTGKKYGVDYLLDPPVIAVSIEKGIYK